MIAVVIAVPFLATKAEEAIQIKNEEFKEKQNNVCYEKAGECMDAGEYDEAIELLEKLPGNYEDAEYIIRYAKFCKAVQNEEGIEELHKLIWNFPKEDKYSGKYAEEMKRVKEDTEVQYEKYMAQKEKEEEEKMRKKDEPYKGMKEKYINITLLGRAKEKRTEHYWRDTPGKRTQDIQYRYMWYNSNGTKKIMAVCRNGRVSSVVEFVRPQHPEKIVTVEIPAGIIPEKICMMCRTTIIRKIFTMIMQMNLMIFRMRKITGRKHSKIYGIFFFDFCAYTGRESVCFQAQKRSLCL